MKWLHSKPPMRRERWATPCQSGCGCISPGWPIRPKPWKPGCQPTVIACLQARVRIRQKIRVQQKRNLQFIRPELALVKLGRNFTSLHQHFQERIQRLEQARVRIPAHIKRRRQPLPQTGLLQALLAFWKVHNSLPDSSHIFAPAQSPVRTGPQPDPSIEFACNCSPTAA